MIQAIDDPFMTEEVLPDLDELSIEYSSGNYSGRRDVGFVAAKYFKPNYWFRNNAFRQFLKQHLSFVCVNPG